MVAQTALPRDNLQAYVPGDRRRALAQGRDLPEAVQGAALFADISGFTPLTEALVHQLGAERGAEELTATLEVVFSALLQVLERHGGSAISFSGDAITCWLDGDDGALATACGLAMQTMMAAVGTRHVPGGPAVTLRLKVAVAVGPARRFVVGDPRVQLIDVLAGGVLDALAAAEQRAEPGQVVLDAQAQRALGDRVDLVGAAVVAARPVLLPPELPPVPALPEDVVRSWVLAPVYDRLAAGSGELLADLRPAVPLFLHFGGLDFDADPGARRALDELVVQAQQLVDAGGGHVLQLTIGDKGAYLYAVFGAPNAHEDDAARACWAALQLLRLEGCVAATGLRIGIGSGPLRSGTYGSAERRTFCCLGDAVNLAARLMSAAPPGQAWVSEQVQRAAGEDFRWEQLPSLQVKGKAVAVQPFRLVERRARSRAVGRHTGSFVGRTAELGRLLAEAQAARSGDGRVVVLTGEAGLGKTRLLAALDAELLARDTVLLTGATSTFGASSDYEAWGQLLGRVLGVPDGATGPAVGAVLPSVLGALDPALLPRLPLLGALFGVELPDTALTATFDAKLRKTSLETLVVQVLTARSRDGLLALAVEDAQWLDDLSGDLLETVARAAARLPLLLVVTGRSDVRELPGRHVVQLELTELEPAAALELARARVAERGAELDGVPEALLGRLVERAQGNPFHLEELLSHLVDRQVDLRTAQLDDLDLPGSLQSLVLARIDDLREGPRRTLKVASIAGRRFETDLLAGAYPDLGDEGAVEAHLLDLTRGSLVVPEPAPAAYAFRHALTEEVAYASLPFAVRSVLHDRVGGWLERSGRDVPLDLLAHHFGRGTDDDRKRDYLLRAGRAAQDRYANEAAVGHYRRALDVVPDAERAEVLSRLGKVLELRGHWDDAAVTYEQALQACREQDDVAGQGRALADLAEVARKRGRFEDATGLLAQARQAAGQAADEAGLGRVLHLEGTLASQQGRYDEARAAYRSSLEVRERLGDRASVGALLSNLAVVAEQEGDYDEARRVGEQALAVREALGDPWAVCVSRTNLGMVALLQQRFDDARGHVEESTRLAAQVGDLWLLAVGSHNLANALLGLQDTAGAAEQYLRALAAYVEHDDRWSLAMLAEDVALLAVRLERHDEALSLVAAADTMRADLAAPRAPAAAIALEAALAPARAAGAAAGPPQEAEALIASACRAARH